MVHLVSLSGFITGLQQLQASTGVKPISTGSPELDEITGGIRQDMFYLYYGEKPLIEILFRHVLAHSLEARFPGDRPVAVYMICGNYRRERIDIDTDLMVELIESSGFHMEEALQRIYFFTASSADQQGLLVEELERLIERESNISLVMIRGIYKLHRDDARTRNRHVVVEEVQRSIIRLRQICARRGIPIVASGREARSRRLLPQPEASSFLKHLANVIIYLRGRGKDSRYNRAFIVKSPTRTPRSIEYCYQVDEELGRTTPPFRQSFQDRVSKLRREFQDALMDSGRRTAFDGLVKAWSGELGAMSYAETMKMLDLMLLVSALDNRSLINKLQDKVDRLEVKMKQLEAA
jgi:hypothetical protein